MNDSVALIDRLRGIAAVGSAQSCADTDDDDWLCNGLPRGKLHEIYALDPADAASAAGFAAGLILAACAVPIFWLRIAAIDRDGRLHASGLRELGIDPQVLITAVVDDEAALLRAAADAARCPSLGTLLVEVHGRAPGLDLTATRRLMLAAEGSGVTVFALRIGAEPVPSAAATRWGIVSTPSMPLAANAPGGPAFDIELLRRRGGPAGRRWRVEWDRDTKSFLRPPLPGARLPLVAGGAASGDPPAPLRRTG